VQVVLGEDRPVGFYALKKGDDYYLDHLWLLPEVIGRGLGRIAFEHAVQLARESGMSSFLIISDFHAEGFYLKMGARKIGEFFSPHQNRMLPKLIFQIPESATQG
jgi:GNAT superfamily N-acetyltransferase